MVNHKTIFGVLLYSIVLLLSIGIVNAAFTATWDSPTTGMTINGTFNFTVTIASANAANNITFYYVNGSNPQFTFYQNLNANQTTYGSSNDTTTLLTEGTTYTIGANVSGYPNLGAGSSTNRTQAEISVTIDQTVPTVIFRVDRDTIGYMDGTGIQVNCGASTDNVDTGLSFNITGYTSTGRSIQRNTGPTASTGITDFSNGDLNEKGDLRLVCSVSDNANLTTHSANFTVRVISKTSDEERVVTQQLGTRSLMFPLIIVLGAGIVVIGLGSMAFKGKGKR